MKKLIINQDCTCMLSHIARYIEEGTFKEQDLIDFPKQFEGTQITDYFINVDAVFPSKVRSGFLGKYHQKTENGKQVDYSGERMTNAVHHMFEVMGIDHNAILIEGFRKVGINPWISFRMNDIHGLNNETDMSKSDFYHAHPETRRVKFHPEYIFTNADLAYDYTYDCVREHYLAYIEEALDRYDAYGIELDYQRECQLFGEGYYYDGREIMNDFMRKVKALTEKYAKKYGHEIKIAARVLPDIQTNMDFGMNVMQWVKEGLVDMLIPTGRFESNDMDMPIDLWKTLLDGYNVELIAGIDMYMRPDPSYKPIHPSINTFAACAASAYSQGADGIYFFNFFHVNIHDPLDHSMELCFDPNLSVAANPIYWTVINTLADPEWVAKMNRHHIVTHKDIQPLWRRYCMGDQQLPQTFWRQGGFKIHTGDIPNGAKLTFRFAIKDDEHLDILPRVFMNSEACEYIGTTKDERYSDYTLMCYDVPVSAFKKVACSYIIVKKTITVTYVDLLVEVAK